MYVCVHVCECVCISSLEKQNVVWFVCVCVCVCVRVCECVCVYARVCEEECAEVCCPQVESKGSPYYHILVK